MIILEMTHVTPITDYFLICSGTSERQVKTICDEISARMLSHGISPYRSEGEKEARWAVLDYVDVVVHVFHKEEREFYELERLWKDAPVVPFLDPELVHKGGVA